MHIHIEMLRELIGDEAAERGADARVEKYRKGPLQREAVVVVEARKSCVRAPAARGSAEAVAVERLVILHTTVQKKAQREGDEEEEERAGGENAVHDGDARVLGDNILPLIQPIHNK